MNYVGASDLEITFKHRGEDAYREVGEFSYREEWVGPTAEYRAVTSPVNFVERIRVPTLHAYGEKDPRVKIDHWTRLEAQLRQHGKEYESVSQRRQGHGFRDEKASVGFYGQLEDFLARLFGIESEAQALAARHNELAPLYSVKRLFVQRRAVHKVKPEDASPEAYPFTTELAFATQVTEWLKEEAANAEKLEGAARYAEIGRAHV